MYMNTLLEEKIVTFSSEYKVPWCWNNVLDLLTKRNEKKSEKHKKNELLGLLTQKKKKLLIYYQLPYKKKT